MTIHRHAIGSGGESGPNGFMYRERLIANNIAGADIVEAIHAALIDPLMPTLNESLLVGGLTTIYVNDRQVLSTSKQGATARIEFEILWKEQIAPTLIINTNPDDDGDGVTTVGSVVEQVQTEFDEAGAEITVKRDTNSPDIIQPVVFRRPRWVLEHSRWEETNPRTRAETFVGNLNLGAWNGYADGTVLCTGIVGTTSDGGTSYDVRYTFEYDPNGWDTVVVFIDPDTGRPPSGLVDNVSKKTITLYTKVSFASLNISL